MCFFLISRVWRRSNTAAKPLWVLAGRDSELERFRAAWRGNGGEIVTRGFVAQRLNKRRCDPTLIRVPHAAGDRIDRLGGAGPGQEVADRPSHPGGLRRFVLRHHGMQASLAATGNRIGPSLDSWPCSHTCVNAIPSAPSPPPQRSCWWRRWWRVFALPCARRRGSRHWSFGRHRQSRRSGLRRRAAPVAVRASGWS